MKSCKALVMALVAERVDTVFGEMGAGVDRRSVLLQDKYTIKYIGY